MNAKTPSGQERQEQNWKELRVGDRVRIVAIPEADQIYHDESGDKHFDAIDETSTYSVLKFLVDRRAIVTISFIDEYKRPWFTCDVVNKHGKSEEHSLIIWDDESWERVV